MISNNFVMPYSDSCMVGANPKMAVVTTDGSEQSDLECSLIKAFSCHLPYLCSYETGFFVMMPNV